MPNPTRDIYGEDPTSAPPPACATSLAQLADEHEHLRDTVFFAIYGKKAVFDTYDNAHEYQVQCKAKRAPSLPIVIQEDGTVLVSELGDRGRGRDGG